MHITVILAANVKRAFYKSNIHYGIFITYGSKFVRCYSVIFFFFLNTNI